MPLGLNPSRTGWMMLFAVVATVALVACGGDGDENEAGDESDQVEPTAAAGEASPTPEPELTATPEPPTPTPEPTPTPVNTNENVRDYAAGHALYNRGDYVQAERRFSIVIEVEPEFARGYEGRASALMAQGKHDEAIEDFTRAIELKPNLGSAYAGRAVAYMAVGNLLGANQDAVQARILDPEDPNAVIVLGRILSGAGRIPEALEMFNDGVELAPDEGPAYWWRGRFFFQIGSYDLAMADLDIAIELSPVNAQPYLDRATIHMDVFEDFEAAREDILEARSLGEEPRDRDILDQADAMLELLEQAEAAAAAG